MKPADQNAPLYNAFVYHFSIHLVLCSGPLLTAAPPVFQPHLQQCHDLLAPPLYSTCLRASSGFWGINQHADRCQLNAGGQAAPWQPASWKRAESSASISNLGLPPRARARDSRGFPIANPTQPLSCSQPALIQTAFKTVSVCPHERSH